MFLFRGTWIIIFLGLFFATTLTFADNDDFDYEGSCEGSGEGEYLSFLFYVPVFLIEAIDKVSIF